MTPRRSKVGNDVDGGSFSPPCGDETMMIDRLYGELSPLAAMAVDDHLIDCIECREICEDIATMIALFSSIGMIDPPTTELDVLVRIAHVYTTDRSMLLD